ncbi:hypothetical protein, partial [Pseudoalteromonas luteoviolacea]|uniref:hypothetical protein n=1 Tax=Pseudoalteromonas luteoviolacea TaxID=43657 RepID=UPI001E403CE5
TPYTSPAALRQIRILPLYAKYESCRFMPNTNPAALCQIRVLPRNTNKSSLITFNKRPYLIKKNAIKNKK